MSLFWRDEIGAALAPRRLCLIRVRGGLKSQLAAEHDEIIEDGKPGDWTVLLRALERRLAEPTWQKANIRVVLSDCWVRYAVVPWSSSLTSPRERLTHARQLLIGMYGEVVSDWEICSTEGAPGGASVVCTIPAALVNDVRAACARHRVRLLSLQPQLVASYEVWRRQLPRSDAWFVSADSETLAAAHIGPRGWDRVHTVRIGANWAPELQRLQTFARIASDSAAEGRVFVDAPIAWREVSGPEGRELEWLEESTASATVVERLGRLRRLAA